MTSYDESINAVRIMKLGAEDYIPKKLLLDVVYERLEEIIDKQKRLVELNNNIVYGLPCGGCTSPPSHE